MLGESKGKRTERGSPVLLPPCWEFLHTLVVCLTTLVVASSVRTTLVTKVHPGGTPLSPGEKGHLWHGSIWTEGDAAPQLTVASWSFLNTV